jgi:hypothetical protein
MKSTDDVRQECAAALAEAREITATPGSGEPAEYKRALSAIGDACRVHDIETTVAPDRLLEGRENVYLAYEKLEAAEQLAELERWGGTDELNFLREVAKWDQPTPDTTKPTLRLLFEQLGNGSAYAGAIQAMQKAKSLLGMRDEKIVVLRTILREADALTARDESEEKHGEARGSNRLITELKWALIAKEFRGQLEGVQRAVAHIAKRLGHIEQSGGPAGRTIELPELPEPKKNPTQAETAFEV